MRNLLAKMTASRWGFALLVSFAPAMPTAFAGYPETFERWERLGGFGWGDGYHACRSSGVRPFADLPPRTFSSQSNTPLQRVMGCQPNRRPNYYDLFDAHCDRTACDGRSCDTTVCDERACDSVDPALMMSIRRAAPLPHGAVIPSEPTRIDRPHSEIPLINGQPIDLGVPTSSTTQPLPDRDLDAPAAPEADESRSVDRAPSGLGNGTPEPIESTEPIESAEANENLEPTRMPAETGEPDEDLLPKQINGRWFPSTSPTPGRPATGEELPVQIDMDDLLGQLGRHAPEMKTPKADRYLDSVSELPVQIRSGRQSTQRPATRLPTPDRPRTDAADAAPTFDRPRRLPEAGHSASKHNQRKRVAKRSVDSLIIRQPR